MHFDNSASTSTLVASFLSWLRCLRTDSVQPSFGHEPFHRYAPIRSRVDRVREIEFVEGILQFLNLPLGLLDELVRLGFLDLGNILDLNGL